MLYRWINGEEGGGWFCSKFNSSPSAPSYRFIIAGTIFLYRVDVPFVETTLSSSLLFLPSSLREEGETSQTLVACRGRGEGEGLWKKCPCKGDFSSLVFVPSEEGIPPFPLLAIYLTTTKFLRNRFSPSAIQTANYLRSRRSTFNTGRENTYITFVIGGEDE